ncbi:gephyrin-like molybdotransferase Glp [Lentibacter sp. XHP0401]|uniref:molybdopterin molybdotransferase MoeA n=1 Tax=Lentibacter sp. XHP0401 TaxID=2984334 RepID=UPI0021E894C3|nr:gephyrin-like molybdotransferase Glp [Lentibacter sp. XHP0401]MCV2892156.1 molybdopterin molybdotransferase MoeA [Lentibacter sp. XHP0401]
MISVEEALAQLFALVRTQPTELCPIAQAAGRVLAEPIKAKLTQPPFASSSMDGYALNSVEADLHAQFVVVGESAAGHSFIGKLGAGQAVRIFTGAPVPEGADMVAIQEEVERRGKLITLLTEYKGKSNIRPAGQDFMTGDEMSAPRQLTASDIALAASMNHAELPVYKRPVVALVSTGDELVQPGETPAQDQIIASNTYGLKALLDANGAEARILPIARDTRASLETVFALCEGADLIVTIGGASVGDHDIVADVAAGLGLEQSFYKVAMRPGKPLMAGRMGRAVMIGLPGNPVSAMVCGHVFLLPFLRAMTGLKAAPSQRFTATLSKPLEANGPREHYMRARVENGRIAAESRQDSALLSVLAKANALLIRPPHDSARGVDETVEYIWLS